MGDLPCIPRDSEKTDLLEGPQDQVLKAPLVFAEKVDLQPQA